MVHNKGKSKKLTTLRLDCSRRGRGPGDTRPIKITQTTTSGQGRWLIQIWIRATYQVVSPGRFPFITSSLMVRKPKFTSLQRIDSPPPPLTPLHPLHYLSFVLYSFAEPSLVSSAKQLISLSSLPVWFLVTFT